MDNILSSGVRFCKIGKGDGGLLQQYTNIIVVKVADLFSLCNICYHTAVLFAHFCKSPLSSPFLCE